jgi:hypothetical protein
MSQLLEHFTQLRASWGRGFRVAAGPRRRSRVLIQPLASGLGSTVTWQVKNPLGPGLGMLNLLMPARAAPPARARDPPGQVRVRHDVRCGRRTATRLIDSEVD